MEVTEKIEIMDIVKRKALTYEQYHQLIKKLLWEGKTTGDDQDVTQLKHAKLNFRRMKRVFRTTQISEDLKDIFEKIDHRQLWVVLSEGWCGDAAENLPAIARLVEITDKIDLRILLRDENPELMEAYLTNGRRSIPKLIVLDDKTKTELFTWGPRPKIFQDMVHGLKIDPQMSPDAFYEVLHKEYNIDKTTSLQKELFELVAKNMN
jgi:hypothetical protein